MKKFLPLAVIACAVTLCLALVGCGGSGGSGGDNKIDEQAFVGSYTLTEIVENGEATSQDDLEMLASLGMEFGLELNADHSASMSFFGEDVDGTWEATSATAGKINLSDFGAGTFTLEGDQLVMQSDGDKLTFTKNS